MKVCSNCGHLLEDNVRFCDSCGQPIAAPEPKQEAAPAATGTYFTPAQPAAPQPAVPQQTAQPAAPQTSQPQETPTGSFYTPPQQAQAAAPTGSFYTPPQTQAAPAATPYTPPQQAQPYNGGYAYPQQAAYQPTETKASTGLAILSFFIPLVGIIIYFAEKKTRPLTAKKSLKCALISIALQIILGIISVVAITLFGVNYAKKSGGIDQFAQEFGQQLEDQFGEEFAQQFEDQFEQQFGENGEEFDWDSFSDSQPDTDAQG